MWVEPAVKVSAAVSGKVRVRVAVLQGWLQWHLLESDAASTISLIKDCIRLFKDNHERADIAGSLQLLGDIEHHTGLYEDAIIHFNESLSIHEEMQSYEMSILTLQGLMKVKESIGDFTIIERCIDRIEELAHTHHREAPRISLTKSILAVERREFSRARGYLEDFIDYERKHGDTGAVGSGLMHLGSVAGMQGNYKEAKKLILEGLALMWEIEVSVGLAPFFEELASAEICLGGCDRAVRLLGVAEALRGQYSPVEPVDRPRIEQNIEAAMESLGDDTYYLLIAEGREMPLEQAVEYALETGELKHQSR